MTAESTLAEAAQRVIDRRRDRQSISPSWVATEAMNDLDPERVSVEIVYFGCHLQLRQIAREILRKRFKPDEAPERSAQHDLFPDLQWRYPTARTAKNEEPEYVLLESLTKEDINYNVARLRSEAVAKLRHADALEAFGMSRDKAA